MELKKIALSLMLVVGINQANAEINTPNINDNIANNIGDNIVGFLKKSIKKDMVIEHLKIKKKIDLSSDKSDKWHGYIVGLKFKGKKEIKDLFFSDGVYITQSLVRMKDKKNMRNTALQKEIKDLPIDMYSKEALLYGSGKSKNKMMIISDPLCPFCVPYIYRVLKFLKKNKLKNVDVYYYSFPLVQLHPASEYLSTYLMGLKIDGIKNVYKKYYNYAMKNHLDRKKVTKSEVKELLVKLFSQKEINLVRYGLTESLLTKNINIFEDNGINGTPFVFFNHKVDSTRSSIFRLTN